METNLYGCHVPKTEQDGSIKYDRYAFSREGWTYTQTKTGEEIKVPTYGPCVFTEAMPSIEIDSVKRYGGFYIGRYEVGIENGTQDLIGYKEDEYTAPSNEWTGWKNGKAVVQKDRQVWNYITRDKAKKVAEGMYENNKAVMSRLCSSYAWDTALQFIGGEYTVNSEGDNYSGNLNKTGENSTARKGIYDMGGNVGEWTTEVLSYEDVPCTVRGGSYSLTASGYPAGVRVYASMPCAFNNVAFRSTLFVAL